jgi:hypothetical protein
MKNMKQTMKITRATFTKEEDMLLLNYVEQYGEEWNLIASLMINRNPRQIRERYRFYLDPSISKTPWTREEDLNLIQLIHQYGTRWKKIAESFDGRNEVNVKNRWNYYLSKHCSDIKATNEIELFSMDEQDNDSIISKFNLQETIDQKDSQSAENQTLQLNDPLIEEQKDQQKSWDIFRFYKNEDIELRLFSIEPVKFSEFVEYL